MFSNEKLFRTEQNYKIKNDIVHSAAFDDTSENLRTVKCFQNENSVTV